MEAVLLGLTAFIFSFAGSFLNDFLQTRHNRVFGVMTGMVAQEESYF